MGIHGSDGRRRIMPGDSLGNLEMQIEHLLPLLMRLAGVPRAGERNLKQAFERADDLVK